VTLKGGARARWPTFILAVPRFFEKAYNAGAIEARSRGGLAAVIVDQAPARPQPRREPPRTAP
jgi:hypothetical protein